MLIHEKKSTNISNLYVVGSQLNGVKQLLVGRGQRGGGDLLPREIESDLSDGLDHGADGIENLPALRIFGSRCLQGLRQRGPCRPLGCRGASAGGGFGACPRCWSLSNT